MEYRHLWWAKRSHRQLLTLMPQFEELERVCSRWEVAAQDGSWWQWLHGIHTACEGATGR